MEGKGSFFNIVLLFIIAFLALALAALAGYFFLSPGGSAKPTVPTAQVDTRIPNDEDLNTFPIYDEKTFLNLKSTDANSTVIPIITIIADLDYIIKPKNSSIKDTGLKLEKYQEKIKSLVGTYFQGLTLAEVNKLDAKEIASKELCKQINDMLNANEEKKATIVYEVVFSYWFAAT